MESDYEMPSPHEHEVESAAENDRTGLSRKNALMTAILSRRKWPFWGSIASAAGGTGIAVSSLALY